MNRLHKPEATQYMCLSNWPLIAGYKLQSLIKMQETFAIQEYSLTYYAFHEIDTLKKRRRSSSQRTVKLTC